MTWLKVNKKEDQAVTERKLCRDGPSIVLVKVFPVLGASVQSQLKVENDLRQVEVIEGSNSESSNRSLNELW